MELLKLFTIAFIVTFMTGCPLEEGSESQAAATAEDKCKAKVLELTEDEALTEDEEEVELEECLAEEEEKEEKENKKSEKIAKKAEGDDTETTASEEVEEVVEAVETLEQGTEETSVVEEVIDAIVTIINPPKYASLSLSASSHDFGASNKNSQYTKIITVSNEGDASASSLDFSGLAAPYTISEQTCSDDLAADSDCTITIKYSPSAVGDHADTLQLSYLGANSSAGASLTATTSTLDLSVSGSVDPTVSDISPSSGLEGQSVTITGTNLSSSTVVKIGAQDCAKTSTSATQIVCTIPANSAGDYNVSVSENGKSNTYASFTQLAPASLSINISSQDYDDVRVGYTSVATFTLTNNGGYQASSLSISGLAAPYSQSGGTCGSSLSVGSNCTIEVTFAPTTIANGLSDTLEVDYNNGVAAATTITSSLVGDGIDTVVDMALGNGNTFFIYHSGTVKAVGYGFLGSLGNGVTANSSNLETVSNISNFDSISAYDSIACGHTTDDKCYCWGRYKNPNDSTKYATPQLVANSCKEVRAGNSFIVIRNADDTVQALGHENVLSGNGGPHSDTLVSVNSWGSSITATKMCAGNNHVCGLTDDNKVYCHGHNSHRQMGVTGISTIDTPQLIDLTNVEDIECGERFTVFKTSDNKAYVLGADNYRQHNDSNATGDISLLPTTPVLALSDVSSIHTHGLHILAIKTDGTSVGWGYADNGQIGYGSDNSLHTDAQTIINGSSQAITNFSKVFGGYIHSCALDNVGDVYCWGDNSQGQILGSGNSNETIPTKIIDLWD